MKIILGSASKGRQDVMWRMGLEFEVMKPEIDEKAIRSSNYYELPLLLARTKAKALIPKIEEPALLITGDQVVVWNGELREKPASDEEARSWLSTYHEHPAETVTAVVVTNTATGKQAEGVDIAKVYFKPIPEEVMRELIAVCQLQNHAGGFAAEHPLFRPYVNRREGTMDSVTGLPIVLTRKLLHQVQ